METANYPLTPTTTPLVGTLLDTATVTDQFTWLDGRGLFDSYNCMAFDSAAEFCAPSPKTFDNSINWVSGKRFAVYGGVQCKAIGLDRARMLSEVERVFNTGESTAVEAGIMEHLFRVATDLDGDGNPLWAAPTDITPAGGAVSPKVGLALLEGFAGRNYVGRPTLHLPLTVASILAVDTVKIDDGKITTKMGSKVVAGAGYDLPNTGPTGAAAAAGERWLYATGEVWIGRAKVEIRDAMATSDNDVFVLAERGYIAAVDCFAAAIRVKVE